MGYGSNVVIWGKTHNMTTGQCLPGQPKGCFSNSCYFDPDHLGGLFGGCIGSGFLTLAVLIAVLIVMGIGMVGWRIWLGCIEI